MVYFNDLMIVYYTLEYRCWIDLSYVFNNYDWCIYYDINIYLCLMMDICYYECFLSNYIYNLAYNNNLEYFYS